MAWRGLLLGLGMAAGAASAAPPPLAVYGELPGCQYAAIAPSGDRYAVVGNLNGALDLIVLSGDAKPLLVAAIGDHKVASMEFADDDHVILWLRSTVKLGLDFVQDQVELTGALVFDVRRKSMTPILAKGRTFGGVRGYYGTSRKDGHVFGYFSAITLGRSSNADGGNVWQGDNPDLYQVDLDSGDARIVAKHTDGAVDRSWLVDGDGKVAAMLETNPEARRWTLRGATAEIARGADPVYVGLAGLSPAGIVIYREDGHGDNCCFVAGAGTPERLYAGTGADSVITDPRDRTVIGYRTDEDHPQTHFLDAKRERVMRGIRKGLSGVDVSFVGASDDFRRVLVSTAGPGDAGTWWLVDITDGSAKPVGYAYAQIPADAVAPMRVVDWTAADGTALHGVLTTPPGREARKLPVIVLPHGGPHARDYPTFDWWAQALAAQGYAVFQPNFRGSTGYGRALADAGDGEWGGKMLSDVADGFAELGRQGIVDPARACIVGASYGGYAALAGVTVQHGLYRCAVAVAPVSDLASFFAWTIKGPEIERARTRAWKQLIGSAPLDTISPALRAGHADAPILLIHGTGDTVVPYSQSQTMQARLRKAGKPVELVTLPGEDHWLSQSATRRAMLEATVAFVRKHNPPRLGAGA